MPSPPPGFRPSLANLSPERFAALVADLWTAQGRSVEREGRRLTVADEGSDNVVVWPVAADDAEPIPDDADVVVHAGENPPEELPAGATVVGADSLYERLRYAIDREDAERLTDSYLDASLLPASPTPVSASSSESADGDETADEAPDDDVEASEEADTAIPAITEAGESAAPDEGGGPSRRSLLIGAGTFLAGLATATVAGRIDPFDDESTETQPSTAEPPQEEPLEQPADIQVAGLSRDGVTGPRTLAVGHVDRLRDRSFTIDSTKTVHAADGRLLSSLSLTVNLARSRSFRVSIASEGPEGQPLFGEPTARVELWSDRETYLRRVEAADETRHTEYGARPTVNDWYYWSNVVPFDGPPYATLEFYRDLFELVPVGVTTQRGDDEAPYVLTAIDHRIDEAPMLFESLDLDSTIRDLDTAGIVSGGGLISSLDLGYDGMRREAPTSVRWSIEYRDVGAATVERPDWADRALAD
jgi:hypothetical protein